MEFFCKDFSELQNTEIHAIYQLRAKVFVVEQNCPYLDVDEYDLFCKHVLLYAENKLCAYSRILPPGKKYPEPSIGRVVVDPQFRSRQFGRYLMNYSINQTQQLYKNQDIVISAQSYLLAFYNSLGFQQEGEEYLEDGIPHRQMRLVFHR